MIDFTPKTIVLVASPEVRTLCPPEFIEGQWRQVPSHAEEIAFYAGPDDLTCKARPNGKMARRSSDNLSAPIWEVRLADQW